MRATEIGATQIRGFKFSAHEVGILQNCTCQPSVAKARSGGNRARQVGIFEASTPEPSETQVNLAQVGPFEVGVREIRFVVESCSAKIGFVQDRAFEVRTTKVTPSQIRAAEVWPRDVLHMKGGCSLHLAPSIPGRHTIL